MVIAYESEAGYLLPRGGLHEVYQEAGPVRGAGEQRRDVLV